MAGNKWPEYISLAISLAIGWFWLGYNIFEGLRQ